MRVGPCYKMTCSERYGSHTMNTARLHSPSATSCLLSYLQAVLSHCGGGWHVEHTGPCSDTHHDDGEQTPTSGQATCQAFARRPPRTFPCSLFKAKSARRKPNAPGNYLDSYQDSVLLLHSSSLRRRSPKKHRPDAWHDPAGEDECTVHCRPAMC